MRTNGYVKGERAYGPGMASEAFVPSHGCADRADLDIPLADAVAEWLASAWPWERVDRCGR